MFNIYTDIFMKIEKLFILNCVENILQKTKPLSNAVDVLSDFKQSRLYNSHFTGFFYVLPQIYFEQMQACYLFLFFCKKVHYKMGL